MILYSVVQHSLAVSEAVWRSAYFQSLLSVLVEYDEAGEQFSKS